MLNLTDTAYDFVRRIQEQPLLPSSAGLRIARRGSTSGTLGVAAERQPHEGDKVVEYDGARIFLGPHAAAVLKGKTLDAGLDDRGRLEFRVVHPA